VAVQYSEPYRLAQKRVGERGVDETRRYSATLVSFVSTRPDNRLYGDLTGRWTDEEGRLFPGITPVVLGGVAFAPPIAATAIAYGGGLAFTAGAALGMNGPIYPVIRAALPAFRGLRAPARYGVLIQLCLSVLAALGLARLARWRPRYSTALTAASLALITLEYSARPVLLMGLAGAPPPIYRWLSLQVPGTVTLELPVPKPDVLPEMDPFYTYNSVWHWQPLINGYSGHYYPPYLDLLKSLTTFPSPESTRMLTLAGVHLVIVHKEMIPKGRYEPLIARLDADPDYRLIKIADDEVGEARAYVFLPNYGKSADSPGSGR
jgi:hypothetical protein